MKRIQIEARPDWQAQCEKIGFNWHTLATEPGQDPKYWDESVAYEFTEGEIEKVEDASANLYRMCLSAVQHVIEQGSPMLSKLAIPSEYHDLIKKSWDRQDIDLYGRFDFAFDANGTPKMLEFNADTPTSLLEASVAQWLWMEDYAKRSGQSLDQFNSIHERMIEVMKDVGTALLGPSETMYFAAVAENAEDFGTAEYLRDCAHQAGLSTKYINIEDIGWNGRTFTDLDEKPINTIFKLYPWEWLIREEFGLNMIKEPWDVIEPAWKLILSNKGILPILWELYEGHENLLPSYWSSAPLGGTYVEKPMLAREGADVKIIRDGKVAAEGVSRGYDNLAASIFQEYLPLQKFDGMTPILGSWIVGGRPSGMGIREDVSEVTGNLSHFIPHYFLPES
jgi:glutathionylspermidine synthase